MPLLVPSPDLLARFENTCASLLGLARVLSRKSRNLRTSRDLLLPKLISGELDVSNLPEPQAAAA
ncbi:type I restriction system specificity protein [mine drainage metagenome]|uniref:Type I restriction system specificity protein n=1 Tax=mine drainage metagenome TaxID=410659 RepID=T1ASA4_9ZZZZ